MTHSWEQYRDKQLLDLRFCDLNIDLKNSRIAPLIDQLYKELAAKGLKFKPHIWVSKEWFSPDGIPGFAVPFFVANDRLAKLEKKLVTKPEGYCLKHCMKLLRHEAAHAIDNAFHLRKNKKRQKLFGLSTTDYPDFYFPKAYSKKYVVHLDSYYAQAHPDEDWAESFAVWLDPTSNWKKRYENWSALEKLELVDEIMKQIKGQKQIVNKKATPDNIKSSKQKLKTYYQNKRQTLGLDKPFCLDRQMTQLFSAKPSKQKAAHFIRRERKLISKIVASSTGQYQYTIDLILKDVINNCNKKNLYLKKSENATYINLVDMLNANTLNYVKKGHHRILM